jgi:glycerophosphoryl diester phosphodiesterase
MGHHRRVPPPPVMVVAHRGSSGDQPEHTLGAYEAAIAEGADALECDIRLTRDGVLVCVHDRRVDRTSDGRGVVSTLEMADLDELDFASWKGSDRRVGDTWEEPDRDRGRVLTLETLLQLVRDHDRPVQLHIETKHPTRYGALVERTLVDLLAKYGLAHPRNPQQSPVTVMSFRPTSLRRVHYHAPTLPTVLLLERVMPHRRDGSLPPRVGTAGPKLSILKAHPRYVERVHQRGGRVHVFTVDDDADIDMVLALGVDAVISNHPQRVLAKLGR